MDSELSEEFEVKDLCCHLFAVVIDAVTREGCSDKGGCDMFVAACC